MSELCPAHHANRTEHSTRTQHEPTIFVPDFHFIKKTKLHAEKPLSSSFFHPWQEASLTAEFFKRVTSLPSRERLRQPLPLPALSRQSPGAAHSFPTFSSASGATALSSVSSVVSDSLRPREPQHARPPCPSRTPGVYSNPCPSSR